MRLGYKNRRFYGARGKNIKSKANMKSRKKKIMMKRDKHDISYSTLPNDNFLNWRISRGGKKVNRKKINKVRH